MNKPPEIIYLIPEDEYSWVWCEDPAPGLGMDEEDAVKYVRSEAPINICIGEE